jgi:hypothetical protein
VPMLVFLLVVLVLRVVVGPLLLVVATLEMLVAFTLELVEVFLTVEAVVAFTEEEIVLTLVTETFTDEVVLTDEVETLGVVVGALEVVVDTLRVDDVVLTVLIGEVFAVELETATLADEVLVAFTELLGVTMATLIELVVVPTTTLLLLVLDFITTALDLLVVVESTTMALLLGEGVGVSTTGMGDGMTGTLLTE